MKKLFSLLLLILLQIGACGNSGAPPPDNQDPGPFTFTLPDTGQITSYTATRGEDSDYRYFPREHTDNGNGTFTDGLTGLTWQYAPTGETGTWQNAVDYCTALDLGGFNDWRLPTILEYSTVTDYENLPGPGGEVTYTWTSHADPLYPAYRWTIRDDNGTIGTFIDTAINNIRCTRGHILETGRFTINSDNTATDESIRRMWQRTPYFSSFVSWENALNICENLELDGFMDWRIPDVTEFLTIFDYSRIHPAVDPLIFYTSGPTKFWSSTTTSFLPTSAFTASINVGILGDGDKGGSSGVLCVRNT